jgi:hypothetical protein
MTSTSQCRLTVGSSDNPRLGEQASNAERGGGEEERLGAKGPKVAGDYGSSDPSASMAAARPHAPPLPVAGSLDRGASLDTAPGSMAGPWWVARLPLARVWKPEPAVPPTPSLAQPSAFTQFTKTCGAKRRSGADLPLETSSAGRGWKTEAAAESARLRASAAMDLTDRKRPPAEWRGSGSPTLADGSIARLLNPPPQAGAAAPTAAGGSHALPELQPDPSEPSRPGGCSRVRPGFQSRAAVPLRAEAAHGMFAWAAGQDSQGPRMLAASAPPWWNWMPSIHAASEVAVAAWPCDYAGVAAGPGPGQAESLLWWQA